MKQLQKEINEAQKQINDFYRNLCLHLQSKV